MLYRLLLSDAGFIAGIIIEGVLTVAAVILLILVLKYGLPNFEKKEAKPKKVKQPPVTYALAYVSGGALGDAPAVEQYAKGAKVILKSNMFAAPAGKQFGGWSDGTKKYSAGSKFAMPAQAITFTAQWVDIPKEVPKPQPTSYALAYASGGALGDAPAVEQYTKGSKITLKSNMFATPSGKQFDGWSDGVKKYSAGSVYVMPEQAVTFTAQWLELPKEAPKPQPTSYALAYVSGGALGEAPAVEQYTKGSHVKLKSNMFATPVGKQFDGWSDGVSKYPAGSEFLMPEQAVTFTAQWLELPKKEVAATPAASDAVTGDQPDQQLDGGMTPDGRPIIVNVYNTGNNGGVEKTIEKETIRTIEEYTDEGLEFANYSILELYGLLSEEQKRYYDTLKKAALSKPEAKLSVTKSSENIKIGKRSILKLRIRRLITVGEYSLENDILKDFKKNDANKAGNSKIKIRPTLVAVTDESTLQTALNMIDLVHKQILES